MIWRYHLNPFITEYINLNSFNMRNVCFLTEVFRIISRDWLPVETGRWTNIARIERFCAICNNNCIGDEYHFILECT